MRRRASNHRLVRFAIGIVFILLFLRSCSGGDTEDLSVFTVSTSATADQIRTKLASQEFMQGRWIFGPALLLHGGYHRIRAGGYKIPAGAGSWTLASILTSKPSLLWVTIPEGLRREQVADRLAKVLGWDDSGRNAFLTADVTHPYDLDDGFYFPDTYLIPVDETQQKVAQRFVNRFNDSFQPYVEKFREANIKFDTAIKIASLIQREAAGRGDMPLIAGVIWNRLLIKMPLQIDATLQYARGDTGSGSWAPISVADKQIDSPFNTYKNAGLPPSPISNPGLAAIDAVLHPEETKCLFYIHDNDRQIHCAVTYEEHLQNIRTYLKGE